MLLVSIHSVFLAFKGVLMTLLSVAAAYGSLVMVFQWGWLDKLGLLSFPELGSIDSIVPPLVLAMTFGLSMDYEIFLLTRIRERFVQSEQTRDAVAYGVSTSARTITSAALIMIAVFIGFAFAGMPLVAEIGVACAVAIAVDATVVRLVLVPALMAMFAQWNWWLPRWMSRVLPSVDFDRPLPEVDLGDILVIPEDISALIAPNADLRMVLKSAAKLKHLAPDAVCVADPLAFTGCGRMCAELEPEPARTLVARAMTRGDRPVHPVTLWRRRLSVAIDALETKGARQPCQRRSPVETAHVQLPTGDRLLIPTGAEALRLKSYLIMCRNSRRDYAEFADMVDAIEPETAATVLAGMDSYYCGPPAKRLPPALGDDPVGPPACGSDSIGHRSNADVGTGSQGRLGGRPAALPVGGGSDAGGGEVTLAADRSARSPAPPPRRPLEDQQPVEFWSTAAIRSALQSGDIATWKRIATALKRDPYGRTARQVEEILDGTRPSGIAKALWEVLERARAHLEANERAEVARHVRLLIERSGLGATGVRVPDRGGTRRSGRLPRRQCQPVGVADDPDAPAVGPVRQGEFRTA